MSQAQDSYIGQLVQQITPTRLAPYLHAASGDSSLALARYYWNAELCRSYYPILQALEVALRNNLDRACAKRFPTLGQYEHINSWIDRKPRVAVHTGAEGSIGDAKSKLIKDPTTGVWRRDYRNHNDLVAAMSFGFWIALLTTAYEHPGIKGVALWNRDTAAEAGSFERQVFPNAKGETMSSIRSTFNQLRHFRNRVFHHEPVWQKRPQQASPKDRYDALCKALRWLGGGQSQVPPALHKAPDMFDADVQVPLMRSRLIETIDTIIDRARPKKDPKGEGGTAPLAM